MFAVIKSSELNNILNILNAQYEEINFTCETKVNNKLDFFFFIWFWKEKWKQNWSSHKPTSTLWYITSDSYSPIQYKLVAFHSLAYRLINLPLSLNNYIIEYNYIQEAVKINGYIANLIDDVIKKNMQKRKSTEICQLCSLKTAVPTIWKELLLLLLLKSQTAWKQYSIAIICN